MKCKKDKYSQLGQCSCSMIRKSARKITQYYDASLREAGIKSTQFSILAALANMGAIPLTQLAEGMGIDRTGLTRNLNVLNRNGWVHIQAGKEDSRQRVVSLSEKGFEQLDSAIPYWKKAQNKIKTEMGVEAIARLQKSLGYVHDIISE